MQQFTVPQFIDVEDKIIGPITARQFLIMLSGFMLIAVCYKIFSFNIFLILAILIFAISGVFAFFKVNGMPFHFFVLNFSQTTIRPGKRIWNHEFGKENVTEIKVEQSIAFKPEAKPRKSFSSSRLNELALIVDTQGAYQGESNDAKDEVKIDYENKIPGKDF